MIISIREHLEYIEFARENKELLEKLSNSEDYIRIEFLAFELTNHFTEIPIEDVVEALHSCCKLDLNAKVDLDELAGMELYTRRKISNFIDNYTEDLPWESLLEAIKACQKASQTPLPPGSRGDNSGYGPDIMGLAPFMEQYSHIGKAVRGILNWELEKLMDRALGDE